MQEAVCGGFPERLEGRELHVPSGLFTGLCKIEGLDLRFSCICENPAYEGPRLFPLHSDPKRTLNLQNQRSRYGNVCVEGLSGLRFRAYRNLC